DTCIIVRNFPMMFSLYFALAFFAHSRAYFPLERPELLAKRWVIITPYLIAATVLAAVLIIGNENFIQFGFLGVFALTIVFNLIVEIFYRKKRPAEYKQLNRVIARTGWPVCIVTVALGIYLGNAVGETGIGFIGIPLALIPLAYLYTIGRYRLLDLDLRIRRNIQYTIVSTIWILLIVSVLAMTVVNLPEIQFTLPNIYITGTGLEFADTPIPEEKQVFIEKLLLMIGAIALCLVALKVAKGGQSVINRKFDQGASDYRKAATALAEVMGTNLTMVDLAKGIVQKLALTLHLKRVGVLFFRNQKMCCCQEAYGFEDDRWFDFCLAINPKLIDQLQKFRSESRFSADYLTGDLKHIFSANGFRNVFIIRSKEKLVGALLIGEKRSESPFHQDDLEFLSSIAKQASVAIENAFLYEELAEQERLKHELAIARQIQLASLPQSTPIMDGLEIDGASVPALEVGGDYFDYLNGQPNEITVIVGDVSGKGTSAALYMSKVQGILRSLHGFNLSPRDLFIHANKLLCQDLEKKSFVTAIGGFFDSSTHIMRLARAGHLPLYYYNAKTEKVELVTPKGLGLGLKNNGVFTSQIEETKIEFHAGDVFLFITDGITEAHNTNGEEFGEDRVALILKNNHHLSPFEIRNSYFAAIERFVTDNYQHDDQTLVVVKAK
ncbi:MAG: GAF domain-containing SpoIIE family protein phosphatase, partial [bacterium]